MSELAAHYLRLPVEGMCNLRELGGYPCDGGITKSGVFLRGDSTATLTPGDTKFLLDYGLGTVVDLRSQGEIDANPCAVAEHPDIEYHIIPLIPRGEGDATKIRVTGGTLQEFYMLCLENSAEEFAKVFNIFADAKKCVMFNCTVGKDRTGMIAALLLMLCGVSDEDIIANYQVSHTYIKKSIQLRQVVNMESDFMQSRPETIEGVLAYIRDKFGGAREYLIHCGVRDEGLEAIKSRFIF